MLDFYECNGVIYRDKNSLLSELVKNNQGSVKFGI